MSTAYAGQSTNVSTTFPAPIAISSVAPGPPAAVKCATPHGLSVGQLVEIHGEQVAIQVNGIWTVGTIVNPTTFTLTGVTATNSPSSVGTVQPLTFPTVQIISDGDNVQAGALNPVGQASQDELAYLLGATGGLKCVNVGNPSYRRDSGTTPFASWLSHTLAASTTWEDMGLSLGSTWVFSPVVNGDVVEVVFEGSVNCSSTTHNFAMKLAAANADPSVVSPTFSLVQGSAKSFAVNGVSVAPTLPVTLRAAFPITTTGLLWVKPYCFGTLGDTIQLIGDFVTQGRIWRPVPPCEGCANPERTLTQEMARAYLCDACRERLETRQ